MTHSLGSEYGRDLWRILLRFRRLTLPMRHSPHHPLRVSPHIRRKMAKNLFTIAFAVAIISGIATGSASDLGGFAPIATFLMYGSAVWIGWTCVKSENAKDYAIGAAALVFLNAPAWGNASAAIGEVEWIGKFLDPIFSNLVYIVLLVAAVGMLKSLVDTARNTANAGA